jgi:cold shock protein
MPVGTVKYFNAQKGFGMIAPDQGGTDVFVHISAVQQSGLRVLEDGQRLSYDIEQAPGRISAVNVRLVGSPSGATVGATEVANWTRHDCAAGRALAERGGANQQAEMISAAVGSKSLARAVLTCSNLYIASAGWQEAVRLDQRSTWLLRQGARAAGAQAESGIARTLTQETPRPRAAAL